MFLTIIWEDINSCIELRQALNCPPRVRSWLKKINDCDGDLYKTSTKSLEDQLM